MTSQSPVAMVMAMEVIRGAVIRGAVIRGAVST